MLLRPRPSYGSIKRNLSKLGHLREASNLATVSIHGDSVKPSILFRADVIIIDSNNIVSLGDFQRKEWRFKDYSSKAVYADHLKYLAALAGNPQERYAVFDNRKAPGEYFIGRSRAYLSHWSRHAGAFAQLAIVLLERVLQGLARLRPLVIGTRVIRHPCWNTAAQCGYRPTEPAVGWAADDAIAALCTTLTETDANKTVLVVSNDRDLLQLLEANVSVLQIPAPVGESSFDPYRIWLLEGFKKQWQISPYLAPLLDALTNGRPYKRLRGLQLSTEQAVACCHKAHRRVTQLYGKGNIPSYPELKQILSETLSAEYQRAARKGPVWRSRNLIDRLLLNRDMSSLPEGFQPISEPGSRNTAYNSRRPKPPKWLASSLAGIPNPLVTKLGKKQRKGQASMPSGVAADVPVSKSWEAPTLIWMRPYNRGRAHTLKRHMDRLSRILHMVHIRHISWAVSAQWTAIDVAIIPDEHSAAFGLSGNSAFLILTDGDLLDDFFQLCVSPVGLAGLGSAQVLKLLLQHSNDFVYLNPATKLKIQSLEAEGWKVHKIHHNLLSFYYKLRFPET